MLLYSVFTLSPPRVPLVMAYAAITNDLHAVSQSLSPGRQSTVKACRKQLVLLSSAKVARTVPRLQKELHSVMPRHPVIAAFSDVHGNSMALEAVLKDIQRFSPDLLLNLGDQVWGQVDPNGAYDLQAGLGAVEVRGNNDEKPLITPARLPDFERRYAAWLGDRVPREGLERLNQLPVSTTLLDERILAAHGTPTSPWKLLLWQIATGELVPRAERDVSAELEALDRGVELVLVGHTHRERSMKLDDRLLVNVGPVAWQRDGDPRARWTLLRHEAGSWTAQHMRVEYDWRAAAAAVIANNPVYPPEVDSHLLGVSRRPSALGASIESNREA